MSQKQIKNAAVAVLFALLVQGLPLANAYAGNSIKPPKAPVLKVMKTKATDSVLLRVKVKQKAAKPGALLEIERMAAAEAAFVVISQYESPSTKQLISDQPTVSGYQYYRARVTLAGLTSPYSKIVRAYVELPEEYVPVSPVSPQQPTVLPPPSPLPVQTVECPQAAKDKVVQLINQYRAQHGVAPLIINERPAWVGREHLIYWRNHPDSCPYDYSAFARAAGLDLWETEQLPYGEDGSTSPERAMTYWTSLELGRRYILDPKYDQVGVGCLINQRYDVTEWSVIITDTSGSSY
jgi:uncharacterized protein YkwD